MTSLSDRREQLRLALRAKAQQSTYFMAKSVLGFVDMTLGTHLPMCKFIDAPQRRKLGLAPRDHLKTSCWTIAHCVRLVASNPNIRILLANETATNASHFLRRIEAVFERNVMFQSLFPELIQDFNKAKKWSEQEMLVPRDQDHPESTIEVIGVGGAVVSRHFDHIKLDDLVGKEASESEAVMQKTVDWYLYCESLLVHPVLSNIDLYGTRWNHNDVYQYAEEHEKNLHKFVQSAEETAQGTPGAFWPERFSLEVLQDLRDKMGPFKYSCQYLNEPHDPEGGSFKREWLRFYTLTDEGTCRTELGLEVPVRKLRRFMRVDPAISQSETACRTAIVVDGVDDVGRVFLLETWSRIAEPSEMWDNIFRLQDKWSCEKVGIESVAYQKVLQYNAQDEMARRHKFINVVELKPVPKQSKPGRIKSVQPYFQRGEVFVLKEQEDFQYEYLNWRVAKHKDLIDIFSYGPQVWELPELEAEGPSEDDQWLEDSIDSGRCSLTGY